jgi:polyphenol oxidase
MQRNKIGRFFSNYPGIMALYSDRTYGNMKYTEYKEGEANREFFRDRFLGPNARMAFANVDHGKKVKVVKRCGEEHVYQVDGLVSQGKFNLYLAVTFADCPFVLLADPEKKIIGLAHCGWKPLAKDILYNVFNEMLLMGAKDWNMIAAIGPGICPECYEFDKETALKNFGRLYGRFILPSKKDGKCHLNLTGIIRSQLVHELGIQPRNLEKSRHCTCCRKDKFFSFRGEKMNPEFVKAGIAVVGLK